MRYDLQVISFLCAVILAIFLLLPRIRGNIANFAIVIWLLTCNLIHGINSAIWDDNVDIHVPVWCDIVTRILLGALVALPGACVCISGRMELLSSKRRIPDDPKSQRTRLIIELVLCYLIPILYILLHLTAQDHRFDLVKDYGCSASIFPSGPTLAVMFTPPLLLCALSFGLSGRAIHNSCLTTASEFSVYIESRAPISSSIFVRRVCLSLFLTGVLFIMSLFNVFAANGFLPWTSFADIHKDMWKVQILTTEDEAASVRAAWWVVPVVSIVYILFMLSLGDEVRDGYKWLFNRVKESRSKPRFEKSGILPLHLVKDRKNKDKRPKVVHKPAPRPLTLELRSGWDDMLNEPKPFSCQWSLSGKKTPTIGRSKSPTTSRASSPLPRIDTSPTEEAFIASTMDYVVSPTARSLGIGPSTSMLSPPPVYLSSLQTRTADPFRPASPPICNSPTSTRRDGNPFRSRQSPSPPGSPSSLSPPSAPFTRRADEMPPTPQSIPRSVVDRDSIVTSVLDEHWPQPPSAPVSPSLRTMPSLVFSRDRHVRRPVSPTNTIDTSVSTLWSVQEDSHAREMGRPFQGPGITPPLVIAPKLAVPQPKQQRGLKRMLSVESRYSTASASSDGVYMTVVKETAAA